MKKYDTAPFPDEDLQMFEAERKFLNQEPNAVIYYLNGKMIVRADGGDLYFTDLEDDDKEFFVYGEQMEQEYLTPISELSDDDKAELYKLEQLNREIGPRGIYAVAMEAENKGTKDETWNTIIVHPEHGENTYFRITIANLHLLTPEQIATLPEYNEERTLDDPYYIQVTDGVMFAY
jgi:hypothetical protein